MGSDGRRPHLAETSQKLPSADCVRTLWQTRNEPTPTTACMRPRHAERLPLADGRVQLLHRATCAVQHATHRATCNAPCNMEQSLCNHECCSGWRFSTSVCSAAPAEAAAEAAVVPSAEEPSKPMTPASTRTAEAPEDAADATRSEVGSPEAAAPVADLDTSAPAEAEADTVCLSNLIQSNPMHCSAAVQCSAVRCGAVHSCLRASPSLSDSGD